MFSGATVFRLDAMKSRIAAVSILSCAAVLLVAGGATAALIGIYRNGMATTGQRAQMIKLSGANCARGGLGKSLRVVVGKATKECAYRTPVIGRDLEIAATERLLSATPKPLQHSAFLALNLRSGGGGRYQLAVYPLQRKVQLRKALPEGGFKYLAIERNVAGVKGLDVANELRLRAFNVTSGEEKGTCRLLGFVGGKLVVRATDSAAGELSGRASGFSVGSAKNANGTQASFANVVVRLPSPF
jgi:hypothetical protein